MVLYILILFLALASVDNGYVPYDSHNVMNHSDSDRVIHDETTGTTSSTIRTLPCNEEGKTTERLSLEISTCPESPKCFDGQPFKTQRQCAEVCDSSRTTDLNSLANSTSTGSRYNYKLMHLTRNEYVNSSGELIFQNISLKGNIYWNQENDLIYVCYEMPKRFPSCMPKIEIEQEGESDKDYLTRTFTLQLYDGSKKHYTWQEYVNTCPGSFLICAEHEETGDKAYLSGWIISVISIALTLIAAYFIPELNLKQNKILICHLIMSFFTYFSLTLDLLLSNVHISLFACQLIAYLKYFCILSTFCWINVQAIDLSLRFRCLQTLSSGNNSNSKRFLFYKLYAWGGPFLMSFIVFIVQETESEILNPFFYEQCWFGSDKMTALVYLYGPISLILLSNIILFIFTVIKLRSFSKGAQNANKNIHKELFYLYCKLVIVMGLIWILEVISWAADGRFKHWVFIEMVVALQGLFIFLVYILKPSLFRIIKKKWMKLLNSSKQKHIFPEMGEKRIVSNETSVEADLSGVAEEIHSLETGSADKTSD